MTCGSPLWTTYPPTGSACGSSWASGPGRPARPWSRSRPSFPAAGRFWPPSPRISTTWCFWISIWRGWTAWRRPGGCGGRTGCAAWCSPPPPPTLPWTATRWTPPITWSSPLTAGSWPGRWSAAAPGCWKWGSPSPSREATGSTSTPSPTPNFRTGGSASTTRTAPAGRSP